MHVHVHPAKKSFKNLYSMIRKSYIQVIKKTKNLRKAFVKKIGLPPILIIYFCICLCIL